VTSCDLIGGAAPTHFVMLPILKQDLPVLQQRYKPCGCKMGSPFHNNLFSTALG